ncbi:MAG: ribosome small subunit-dependent GTPase A [Clostridium sp.]|nr:ribosome small subunit-dependent GTPase A [Clostridium sp.]MCM1547298.1 ribosome small subunit-dependent GTPase A [Ruminococcus sp.]
MRGIITKSIGGLYSIESSDGVYDCKPRGIFRKRGISPAVGDDVEFERGVINEIHDRKNSLIRPPLANLDYIVFVVSVSQPSPNLLLLDKFIAVAEYQNIEPVIAVTKIDIDSCGEIADIYKKVGITVMIIDYGKADPVKEIRELLKGKISAFTGNTGVGKSTLLNAICPEFDIPTGEISKKLGRGRHTTRHAELYKLPWGGYIADTPGFSTFETDKYNIIKKEELSGCFREFAEFENECRFRDCSHTKETDCRVLEAVRDGRIVRSRHESYCSMYEEAKKIKEWEL